MSGRLMVWIGLLVPAVLCCVAAELAGPGTLLGWAFIIVSGPAAAAGVAVAWAVQDRRVAK